MSKILACKSIDVDLAEGTLVVGAHSVAIEQKPLDIPIDLFRANDNNLSLVGSLAKRLQITPSAVEGETYREMAAVDQAKREGRRAVLLETPITTKAGANGRRRLNRVPVGPSRSISSISKPSIADPAKQNPRMSSPMESSKPKRTLASTTKKPVLFKSNESLRRDLIHILAISPLAIPELEKRLGKREPEIRLDLSSVLVTHLACKDFCIRPFQISAKERQLPRSRCMELQIS